MTMISVVVLMVAEPITAARRRPSDLATGIDPDPGRALSRGVGLDSGRSLRKFLDVCGRYTTNLEKRGRILGASKSREQHTHIYPTVGAGGRSRASWVWV